MILRLTPIAILLGCILSASVWAEDWPQFRGPGGQGISQSVGVPVEWSDKKNVAWSIQIPGRGWSSPVVSAGKVYLTSAIVGRGPASLGVLCIDAETGKGLWQVEVFSPNPAAIKQMHKKNSPASATPIVTVDRLFVHFGPMGTAALDLTGKILWKQTDLVFNPTHGNGGSPLLVNDELIFNCDGGDKPYVAALDAGTGAVKWRTPRQTSANRHFSFSTPLSIDVDGTQQIVSPGSGFVGGYEPATGREIWRVRYGEGYSVVPRPVFSNGLLFLSSGFDHPVLLAIKPNGARGDATQTNVAWTNGKGAPHTPSPLLDGNEVYFISDAGIVTCANQQSGTVNWTQRLDGNFSASPVLAEGRLYFQSEEGVGYVISAGKTPRALARNVLGERSLASYAVTDHALFIRTESRLFKISG